MRAKDVPRDIVGALTVVALLAPECVAYAQIAGLPPASGLAAAPVALFIYAVLGRARQLIVGATAATAVISAVTVAGVSAEPAERIVLSAALAMLAGVILIFTGTARCGFIARFLTPEALAGFLFGLALVIILREIGTMAGISAAGNNFFVKSWHLLAALPSWSPACLTLGAAALAALLALERYLPRIPATLLVLAVAWVVSAAGDLRRHGVAVVGHIPSTLPSASVPDLPAEAWLHLLGGALGLALIVFVVSYSVTNRVASDDETRNPDREMIALGVANLAAGLAGGFSVAGSPTASPAAEVAGSRGRLTSAFAAIIILVVAVFLTPVFAELPEAALAAVVIAAVRGFLASGLLRRYWARDRRSFWIGSSALLGVLFFGLLPGLLTAVVLSLVIFIADASRLRVSQLGQLPGTTSFLAIERYPAVVRQDGLLILRPDGELFFANVSRILPAVDMARAPASTATHVVLLDLTASFRLGIPVIDGLVQLRDHLASQHISLWFVHLYLQAQDAITHSPLAAAPAFTGMEDAIAAYRRHYPAFRDSVPPAARLSARTAGEEPGQLFDEELPQALTGPERC
jgi:sulfate permease, SulP family